MTQLATTLLFGSSSIYVVDFCNTNCNYVVIFFFKVELLHRLLWHRLQLRCPLFWHKLQLRVIFSMKFQLRCWLLSHNLQLGCYLLDQVPTMLLTFITQLATMLSTLVTQLATTFVVIVRRELGILHEYVSHHRGEFMRKGYRGREKLVCHTGTIDAAWSALRNCIPKKCPPKAAIYCTQNLGNGGTTCSRRRLKHWNASSDGKTCYFSDSTKTSRWKWAATVVKRENTQIVASFFWRIFMKEIRVSPQCQAH